MPFNGSGTFTVVNTFVPNTTILSAAVNQNFTDIATGLSDCLTRDGQAGMTAAFKAISGSVSAPGISFNSDATAGLYLSATGIVGLVAKSLGLLVNSSILQLASATVQSGGSGYAVGDTITLTGGTAINQAVLVVATLSGSAVATVTVGYPGNYSVAPSNPVSQGSTNGGGSSATFNLTFAAAFASSVVTNEAGALPWQRLGSSSFVSGLMAKANGLDFATGIGGANLAAAIGGNLVATPKGILSPISSTTAPIPTSDQTAVTTIFWTPYNGNSVPIYNGSNFVTFTSAQLSCVLTAGAQVVGGIYDVYMFLNAGVPTLGFSPSWAAGTSGSVTAGSCARGTGTGGTALAVVGGIYVNAVAQTVNNSSSTFTVAINQGTYLGSIFVDPANAGKINCHVSFGVSRQWGLWNAYNQRRIILKAGDAAASWTPGAGVRAWNNNTANNLTSFVGLPEQGITYQIEQAASITANQAAGAITGFVKTGIGFNATNAYTGKFGELLQTWGSMPAGVTLAVQSDLVAVYAAPPSLGINVATGCESVLNSLSQLLFGTEAGGVLFGSWRA